MTTRVFLAGILGAIAMFAWSAVAHMFTPLGEAGISEIPNEQPVIAAMQGSIADKTGLYIFPGSGLGPNASRQEREAVMRQSEEKMKTNPSGLLMYHATRSFSFPKLLGVEFITELFEAILVVWLLAQTRIETFGGRVGFVFVAGILAAIATNISYWNWYGFPAIYTASYMTIQIVGFLCTGIVAALVMGRSRPAA